ncbi:MAG TPA: SRPBCC domain-containing protein [Caulobacteraceae bacterium]|nr:SRPBCC domain-containing protein [Caulobacteraceae bacterium]
MSLESPLETIVVDTDLDEPPEKVWRALTEPEVLDRWLAEAKDRAEVVESEPGKRLRLTWRDRDADGGLVESEVTFTLTPMITGGTRLRLVHDGFVHTACMSALARLPRALRRPRLANLGGLAWAA